MLRNNKAKTFIITLVTAIIMSISSIIMYSNICAPKFYDYFIDTGIKYLIDGKYEEAILVFNKAIEIEEKSTEARVYLAEGYIGNDEYDKAVEVLEEAQEIDITNEELLINILEILSRIDADIAYEFLDRFINIIGQDNISNDINEMLDLSIQSPRIPVVNPSPGTYINPISIKLKFDEIKIGHSFYYTTDGSEPNKNSKKYSGKIDINESTTIRLIGYNKNEESTEIITLNYIIDTNIVNDIKNSVNESKELLNNTKIGTNVGDTTEKAKKAFKLVIDKISNLLKKEQLNYNDASNMKIEIENALGTFEDNIIKPTDKSKLQSTINKAQNLYDTSIEGSKEGQFKVGSKSALQKAINEAKKINDSITSSQEKIDNAKLILNNAINKFEQSKVLNFTKEKALQYLKNKFGEPFYLEDGTRLNYEVFNENVYSENGIKYYEILMCYNIYGSDEVQNNRMHQLVCGCNWHKCLGGCYFNVYENGNIKMTNIEHDV